MTCMPLSSHLLGSLLLTSLWLCGGFSWNLDFNVVMLHGFIVVET